MKHLFIVAHPDDETFNCGGTILKLLEDKQQVYILCMTDGSTTGNGKANLIKKIYFNCQVMTRDYEDQLLDDISQIQINEEISDVVRNVEPDYVYTHSVKDLNLDHRIVAESVMVATRPTPDSSIKGLYAFGNIDDYSFSQFGEFHKNHFVSLKSIDVATKIANCSYYSDDIKEYPHPRCKENIRIRDAYVGSLCGKQFAEVYETIYSID